MSALGTIYYIRCSATNRVKIGFTRGNPMQRLANLQTGSASKLGLLCWQPGTIADERALHERFAESRIHGEWFEDSEEVYLHLVEVVCMACQREVDAGRAPPRWAIKVLEIIAAEDEEPETVQ